jgi:hypothetical protein
MLLVCWKLEVGMSLICVTGTLLGNAERPRWRRVTNGRIILWRSWCNRVYPLFLYTRHNTPLVQLSGSVSLVQASWITSSRASTYWGPPFFSCSTEIESVLASLFRFFSAFSISSRLGKLVSTPSSLRPTGSSC